MSRRQINGMDVGVWVSGAVAFVMLVVFVSSLAEYRQVVRCLNSDLGYWTSARCTDVMKR